MEEYNVIDIFKESVAQVSINLNRDITAKVATVDEMITHLETLTQNTGNKTKKYPLCWLLVDFPQDYDNTDNNIDYTASLNIIICCLTDQTYSTEKRDLLNFRKILIPILLELETVLTKDIRVYSNNTLTTKDHTRTNHYFWGRKQVFGKDVKFKDYIDAIELDGYKLEVLKNNFKHS